MFSRFFLVFFILFISTAQADVFSDDEPVPILSKPLLKADYKGSYYSVAKNVRNIAQFQFKINGNLTAILIANRPDGTKQRYTFLRGTLVDNLLVYNVKGINHKPGREEMQLVVDGFKKGADKQLGMTVFLYADGTPKGLHNTHRIIFKAKH